MSILTRIAKIIFSTRAAGLYMLLFAAAIGIATFVENDFGTSSAQKVIFKARWFEALLILFCLCILYNIYKYRFVQQKKWATLCFHASIVVILIGSAITRYFGFEGMMHIREGESNNTFLSSETYLQVEADLNGQAYQIAEPVLFATLGDNHFKRSYLLGSNQIDLEVLDFIPNPEEVLMDDANGEVFVKLVIGGAMGREEYLLKENSSRNINGARFYFGDDDAQETPDAIRIRYQGDSLLVKSPSPLTRMVMATQQKDSLPGGVYHPLMLRSLFTTGGLNFVVSEFNPKARVEIQSKERKMSGSSTAALQLKMTVNGESREFHISGSPGMEGTPRKLNIGNLPLAVSYGSKIVALPFQIKLRDFIMERYPGTNSASSYASEVTLIDPRESATRDIRIYMNHILDHDGYRFFQSSFDKDELGTYLSVNHDAPGTWVSYIGYFLLTLGMILSLFSKSSRFQILKENIQKLRAANKVTTIALVLLAGQGMIQAQSPDPSKLPVVDARHAELFGELVVQDLNGRMKPVQTLALEVLRKLSRKEELYGMNAEQVFLSMAAYPELWDKMPIIKIGKHEKIEQLFNPQDSRIAYIDLFNADGSYKLKDEIRAALNAKPIDRGVFEKEIIKLDEKVNIANMIFSGNLLRLFPVVDHPNNHWEAPNESMGHGMDQEADHFPDRFYDAYLHQIREGIHNKDWQLANSLITELSQYQKKVGSTVYPSDGKLKAEIMLNQLDVFGRLGKLYGLLGLWFVALLFTSVFAPGKSLHRPYIISFYILLACFAFQTLGLGLRWYVSGRAPWSNGYESMIYIAWTTVLAGLLFSRKSLGGLAATTMLSATVLMVAGLSWMDPEITPLVPVLKSYWLTIHVSLEAGSYGFLVLGALIGVLNLILMILTTEQNKVRMDRIIREMSYTSEMTLIGGLIMLSTGTYLGGIWANESWGRYWGWDAKETWALVSILVYSFILHMRLIPGLQSLYAFNTATLFGYASVMMTYFGVNYYLSGLHSYAAGDPVPIPTFVYYVVGILILISLAAFWRNRRMEERLKG